MNGFDMSEFGFEEAEDAYCSSDRCVDILFENPEIVERLDPYKEFMPNRSLNSFDAGFLSENPDVAMRMEVSGKDAARIAGEISAAFADLRAAGWNRISSESWM